MVKARGFTVAELMVAGAISLLAVTAAGSALCQLVLVHRRDTERSRLRQQAQLALARLSFDLRHAGLGVPSSARASGTQETFPPPVFHIDKDALRLMGDLPRPDSPVNGFSLLAGSQPAVTAPGYAGVALLNDQTGDCDVDTSGSPHCDTEVSSLLVAPAAVGGCGASAGAPTCPWSLSRYRVGEPVILANGFGVWDEFQVGAGLSGTTGTQRPMALDNSPSHLNATTPNRGFLSTPDRVFYRLNASDATVERAQCWGSVGASPKVNAVNPSCASGPDSTGWEVLAAHVTRFELDYQDGQGNTLAGLPLDLGAAGVTRRVHAILELSSPVAQTTVKVQAETAASLRLGGTR